MRYITVRVIPAEGEAFHPLGQRLADEPSITREALHQVKLLNDGTAVMLGEDRGDHARYREIVDESAYVHDFATTGADGRWYSYLHLELNDQVRRMVERRRESEAMVEMPVEFNPDGSQTITFVGDDEALGDAVPEDLDYDVEVLETGDRLPDDRDPFSHLTDRQREILDAAVELGYYRNPRGATHEDIAAVVDATPSTVGEHLRKIEARVFEGFG